LKAQAPERHGTKPGETGFREHSQPCALDKAALLAAPGAQRRPGDGGVAQVRFLFKPSSEAGEFSFGLYLIGLLGARGLVGNPFFPYRGFRHRCIYVRRDSKLKTGKELEGTCVYLNSWKTTRNIWTRAALRDEGVRLERID
jgi:hypothetical protein